MDTKETQKIKDSLFELPNLVKKLEAYFSKDAEVKVETPAEEPAKAEAKEEPKQEQDFSAVITAIEKNFIKTSDFEGFKTSLTEASTKVTETITALTAKNEALEAKFAAQEGLIKEVFELVKKIGDTPAEETKFKKKDGAAKPAVSKIDQLMAEAAEFAKQHQKN